MNDEVRRRGSRVAALAYALAWIAAAAIVVGVVLAVLDGDDDKLVGLPPVHETELRRAAHEAGCQLRRDDGERRVNPPVSGGVGALPARPGFYERSPGTSALTAAMRRGVIVIQFRELDGADVDLLRTFQEAQPDGTIVVPNDTRMPYAVAVASYRRLLGCTDLNDRSVDAIQLFRGRFVGTGPDN